MHEDSSYYDYFAPTFNELMYDWASGAGAGQPDQCWLLSPYDTILRNPHYSGPALPHPDDYEGEALQPSAPTAPSGPAPAAAEGGDDAPF